jgi:hypothetical protein
MAILDPNKAYTYRNYFDLQIDPIDLAEYFNYSIRPEIIRLSQYQGEIDRLPRLIQEIEDVLPLLVSSNEQAKREALVFPVVRTVAYHAQALIRVEYAVNTSNQLQGNLDYLLSIQNLKQLLVIEAKRDDLDYGFTQLTAQLIGLDQWERSPSIEQQPILVGAVAGGQAWRLGVLHRQEKRIEQGTNLYTLPEDAETLTRILVNCLVSSDGIPARP